MKTLDSFNAQALDPITFLQRVQRTHFWRTPLWIACLGLAVTLAAPLVGADSLQLAKPESQLWIWLGFLLLTLTAIGTAMAKANRDQILLARQVDTQFSGKSRLEAAAELATSNAPMAKAQREETASWAKRSLPLDGSPFPYAPLIVGIALVFGNLWLAGGFVLKSFANSAVEAPVQDIVPPVAPEASIVWMTPKAEIKATKIEEVPLEAKFTSTTGLRDVTLEVAVNGEHKLSVPITSEGLAKAGELSLPLSLFMDELGVEVLDMVSYYIKGHRNSDLTLPPTTSELQFVEIRPFREDAIEIPGGGEGSCYPLIIKLKVAQLGLLKQNFLLTNADIQRTDPAWAEENNRVSDDQSVLKDKTGEVIATLISKGAPPETINLLTQAVPLMGSAADLIRKLENAKAQPEQGEALALITQCAKSFIKAVTRGGNGKGAPPTVSDPFKSEQQFKLPPREKTPVGELEKAIQEQEKLVQEINEAAKANSSSSSGEEAELAPQQEKIAQQLAQVEKNAQLDNEVQKAVEKARESAEKSQSQLTAEDPAAAQEPAERSLAEMREALGTMQSNANQGTEAALAQAQRELNKAASQLARGKEDPQSAARGATENVKSAQESIREQANAQQAEGAQPTAKSLEELAKEFEKKNILEDLKKLEAGEGDPKALGEKLEALASEIASARLRLDKPLDAKEKTLAELERAAKNIPRLADPAKGDEAERGAMAKEVLEDLQAAAQSAEATASSGATKSAAVGLGKSASQANSTETGSNASKNVFAHVAELEAPMLKLIDLLRGELTQARRTEVVAQFQPDEAPPRYRTAVSDYFENLSRTRPAAP